jgi:oxygen-independent coproporphyrinogen-3 oxidase
LNNQNFKINFNGDKLPGLYLHIPFCIHKCFYCDFFSLTNVQDLDYFVQNLVQEIIIFKELHNIKYAIDTIYFGGGTPSLLNPKHLETIMRTLDDNFILNPSSEITLEANPGILESLYLQDYKKLGINRISLGVQTFDDNQLKFLQRIHTSEQSIEAINKIRKIGIDNLSIDLIYGLPNQTLENWKTDLSIATQIGAEHISAYNLIYEDGTPLKKALQKGKIKLIDEELEEKLYFELINRLSENQYVQYEISNFAKKGFESKHNSKYWEHIPYFGFGPSSHSFFKNTRSWNTKKINNYYSSIENRKLPIENKEILTKSDLFIEKIMLQLRAKGLNNNEILKEFDIDILKVVKEKFPEINEYFIINGNLISVNAKGKYLINEIILTILN